MMDDSWGRKPVALRVRANDREAARAADRERRAQERAASADARIEARAAARDAASQAREAARTARRVEEEARAAVRREAAATVAAEEPAAPRRRRSTGAIARTGMPTEERDTRGYRTVVDEDRIRTLAKRGASVAGLAGAFGLSVAEVEAVLAAG